ncbi:hypothetical protein YC2023_119147 [Brassica napus]
MAQVEKRDTHRLTSPCAILNQGPYGNRIGYCKVMKSGCISLICCSPDDLCWTTTSLSPISCVKSPTIRPAISSA